MASDRTVWCVNRSGIVVDIFLTRQEAEEWLSEPPAAWRERTAGLTADEWPVGEQRSWLAQAEANWRRRWNVI